MENVSDRELFSELFENLISPLLIHVVAPLVNKDSPMFCFQINGDATWKWREVYGRTRTVFDLLQQSILSLSYKLTESSSEHVGKVVSQTIWRFRQNVQAITDGKRRKRKKAETWIKVAVKPDEILWTPDDIMGELNRCCANVEKVAELHDEMRRELAHSGKEFHEVGNKQQSRHLSQIQ